MMLSIAALLKSKDMYLTIQKKNSLELSDSENFTTDYDSRNSDIHDYEFTIVDLLNVSILNTKMKHGFLDKFYELS